MSTANQARGASRIAASAQLPVAAAIEPASDGLDNSDAVAAFEEDDAGADASLIDDQDDDVLIMVTVASGRTVKHADKYHGPGTILELDRETVRHLRRVGALVDPAAKAIENGVGPSYGGNPDRVTLK